VIRVESFCRSSSENPSVIGYGVASNLPLFLGDSVSDIVNAGAGFDIATSTTIDTWGALASREFASRSRVDDGINLVVGRFPGGRLGDVVDTFFVGRSIWRRRRKVYRPSLARA
jgi:hypothetical protein